MKQYIEGAGSVGDAQAYIRVEVDTPANGLSSWSASAVAMPGHSFDFTSDLLAVRVVDRDGREHSGQASMTTHRHGPRGESVELLGSGLLVERSAS